MKIVVQYELDGGYECGCYEITKCFVYESTEAFLVDFENAVANAKQDYDNKREQLTAWQRKEPLKLYSNDKNFEKKKAKHEREWNEWMKERPAFEFTTEFTFCNHQFDFTDFLDLSSLRIYELNDWFETRAREM